VSGTGSKIFDIETDPSFVGYDEITIFAPSGKLGIFVDVSELGPPKISSIQNDSTIKEQVVVGDFLLAIDDVDVRKYTPSEVSAFLLERHDEPLRQITLARKKLEKEMASNVGTMSNFDSDDDDLISIIDEVALYR
jgi:hypothetical protein